MKPILNVLLLSAFAVSNGLLHAQSPQFKKYTNPEYHYSFDMPVYWTIKYSKSEGGVICVPLTQREKEKYKNCYEGIVFRMEVFKANLDSSLASEGNYTKIGDTYYTRDRGYDSVKAKNIKGNNWTGIYHDNLCGITCDDGFHGVGGQCEFIYFSNGRLTVCIDTNGLEFDDAVLKRLLNSFRF